MIDTLRKTLTAGALALALAAPAQAHPLWILPSEFNVSSEQGEWLTFDVSASHTYFGFDKGVGLERLQIHSPDGDRNPLGNYFKGHRRSVFDLLLDQDGTYRIESSRPPFYFTSYKSGKRDTPKRMMADKQQAAARLPVDAREVSTLLIDTVSTVYVTRNTPSRTVTEPQGRGLELKLLSHPNDIVRGEPVAIDMLLDGQPVAGVAVEITPGGTRYRDDRQAIELTTDASGQLRFTPQQAGPWLLTATLTSPSPTPLADEQKSIRLLAFEVIAE